MPGIKGFGGGMSQMVDQIMVAEREPIKTMESKKQKLEAKLTLVGDLEGRLGKVKTTLKDIVGQKNFSDYSLNISDPDVVAGTIEAEKVVPGQWKIEVERLAENAGALSNMVPDKDTTQLGVGYLKFDTPDGEKKVFINKNNNTLDGIAATINNAGMKVNATVVQDGSEKDDGFKLIISSSYYGTNHNMDFPTIYLLDGDQDLYFDQERAAKNGIVKLNGFPVEVVNNRMDEVIPGVSLDLKGAKPGKEVNISVAENYEAVENKLKGFVEAANGALSFVQQQNQMNEKTDTSKTLGGDSVVRTVETRLRQLIQSTNYDAKGPINRLSQLGVEFNRNGTLEFKEDKFKKALKTDPKAVLGFFKGDGSLNSGFIGKTKQMIDNTLSANYGVVSNKKKGLQNQVQQIDRNIENKEKQLAVKEENLRKKFGKLDEQMARLNSQGAQLGALGGGGGNAVSQLLG
jgi:flagellar hook-associated protein 2